MSKFSEVPNFSIRVRSVIDGTQDSWEKKLVVRLGCLSGTSLISTPMKSCLLLLLFERRNIIWVCFLLSPPDRSDRLFFFCYFTTRWKQTFQFHSNKELWIHLDRTPQCSIIGFHCVRNGALKDENLMSRRFSVSQNKECSPPSKHFILFGARATLPNSFSLFVFVFFLNRTQNSLKVHLPEIIQCVICLSPLVCQTRQALKPPVFRPPGRKRGKGSDHYTISLLFVFKVLFDLSLNTLFWDSFSPPCVWMWTEFRAKWGSSCSLCSAETKGRPN